jgi:hypothetical protein
MTNSPCTARLHGLTNDTCALSRCTFPDKNGVQVDCGQINVLGLDVVSLSANLDLCSRQPSIAVSFAEVALGLGRTVASFVLPLIHFTSDSLTYSVPLFLTF